MTRLPVKCTGELYFGKTSKSVMQSRNEHSDDCGEPNHRTPRAYSENGSLSAVLGPDGSASSSPSIEMIVLGESIYDGCDYKPRNRGDSFADKIDDGNSLDRLDTFFRKCDPDYQKYTYTAITILVNVALGGLYALSSTTFLDILEQTDTGIERGALLFIMISVGYTLGSLVSGVLYDIFDHNVIFGSSVALAGIFVIFVPLSSLFPVVVSFLFVSNLFQGSLDSGSTLICAIIWRDKANPCQQALSFFYGIGGIVAPFITEPFLRKGAKLDRNFTWNNTSTLNCLTNGSGLTGQSSNTGHFQGSLYVPFLILGIFTIFTSTPFTAIFIRAYCKRRSPNETQDGEGNQEDIRKTHRFSRKCVVLIIFLIAIFFIAHAFCYTGVSKFSMPFVVGYLGWSKTEGALVNSLSWSAFSGSCLIGMVIAKYIRNSHMVLSTLLLTTVGSVTLLIGTYTSKTLVWVSFVLIFAGSGSLYPSAVSWIDQSLVRVNGKLCGLFVVATSVGEIANSWLFGYLLENISPVWCIYLTLGSCVFQLLMLAVMVCIKYRAKRPQIPAIASLIRENNL